MNLAFSATEPVDAPSVGMGDGTAGVMGSRAEGDLAPDTFGFEVGRGGGTIACESRRVVGVGIDGHSSEPLMARGVRSGVAGPVLCEGRSCDDEDAREIQEAPAAGWGGRGGIIRPGTGTGGALRMLGAIFASNDDLWA